MLEHVNLLMQLFRLGLIEQRVSCWNAFWCFVCVYCNTLVADSALSGLFSAFVVLIFGCGLI